MADEVIPGDTEISPRTPPERLSAPPIQPRHAHRPGGATRLAVVAASVLALCASVSVVSFTWRATERWVSSSAVTVDGTGRAAGVPAGGTVSTQELQRRAGLEKVLAVRARAVLEDDRQGWLAAVASVYREDQDRVFTRLRHLHITSWRYTVGGDVRQVSAARRAELGGDAWLVGVTLYYRMAGDTRDTQRSQQLTVVREGDRWLLAGDGDGVTQRDLWDLGPVYIVDGARSLVIGTPRHVQRLRRYAAETDAAARRVDAVWGTSWPRTVVVQVPEDQKEMAKLLGRTSTRGLQQVAAVTVGELDRQAHATSASTTADRVILNPGAFDEMNALGRRIVLTHEVTHVATRATSVLPTPLWLEEGFADFVAYHDTGLSQTNIARELLADVRRGRGPTALPDQEDFDPTRGDVAPAYVASWLAVTTIAREGGVDTVVRFYEMAAGIDRVESPPSSEEALDTAFQGVLRMDRTTFERQWLAGMRRLARRAA